ncbi:hypothetical protein PSTT_05012 [Puccinia striiformis]|uniref:Uncharacterized protein n=1 Tax=Puccinia striiformis TaxID=27350 RepID=A0A2S4VQB8_9BASI|nr:hypothetical protein PSTT_05012 [Puccinia striiformis]
MLFKYLLAPVALAASVVCYPPGYSGQSPSIRPSPDYVNTNVDFNTCTRKFEQAREPLASSCRAHSVQEATSKLSGLYEPVHTLSNKLHVAIRVTPRSRSSTVARLFPSSAASKGLSTLLVDTQRLFKAPKKPSSSSTLNLSISSTTSPPLVLTLTKFSVNPPTSDSKAGKNLASASPEKLGLYGEN